VQRAPFSILYTELAEMYSSLGLVEGGNIDEERIPVSSSK
jgi:hypothetical protein